MTSNAGNLADEFAAEIAARLCVPERSLFGDSPSQVGAAIELDAYYSQVAATDTAMRARFLKTLAKCKRRLRRLRRGKSRTRFRTRKGPHGDRCARGCFRTIQRVMLADFERTKRMPGPARPTWLKPWIQRELGHEVADAWIVNGQVSVQMLGKLETAEVTVTFTR